MIEIRLPKPGPEIENATITKWESKEGDKIQIGDILAIIKTPIGSFKVAAEEQGILESILQTEGSSIDFDEPIAIMHPDLTISDFPNLSEDENETLPLPIIAEPEASLEQGSIIQEHKAEEEAQEPEEEPIDPQEMDNDEISDSIRLDELIEAPSDSEAETIEEDTIPSATETADSPALRLIPEAPEDEFSESSFGEMGLEDASSFEDAAADTESDTSALYSQPAIEISKPAVEVSPAAKKMADRLGIDISTVMGSGDDGKILYIDIENAIREREALAATETSSSTEMEIAIPNESTDEIIEELGEQPEIEQQETDRESVPEFEHHEFSLPLEAPSFEEGLDAQPEPEVTEETEPEFHPETEGPFDENSETSPELNSDSNSDDTIESTWEEPEVNLENTGAFVLESSFPTLEPELDQPLKSIDEEALADPITASNSSTSEEQAFDHLTTAPDRPFPHYEEISTQFHLSKKDDLIIPFNNNKKSYSEAQLDSNRNVPHFYLFAEVDFTNGLLWIEDHNQKNSFRITLTDLIVKATGQALAMMPEMNAFVRSDRMILKRSINIGITTSVDEGVVTPVIPDVYHKSLHKVSDAVRKNVDLAIKSKVILDYDTTFTVNLLNNFGIKRIIPLITPPQTGCLAIGEIQKKVVPFNDFIAIRSIMEVTLACDSRAIDTTNAAKFLQSIRESLQSLIVNEPDPDWIKGNEQLRLI